MTAKRKAYDALCAYTLTHRDPAFIHQHVVDAFAAQDAKEGGKPVRLAFALVGLYLYVEKGFTGRQIQRVHMRLGRRKQQWPVFRIPEARGGIDAVDVLAAKAGESDRMIHEWCASAWQAFSDNRVSVEELLRRNGITLSHPT